jgi:hypothetical protein
VDAKLKTYHRLYEEIIAPISDHVLSDDMKSTKDYDASIYAYINKTGLVLGFHFFGAQVTISLSNEFEIGTPIFSEDYVLNSPDSIKNSRVDFYKQIIT